MKKSKYGFAIVAIVLILLCVLVTLLPNREEPEHTETTVPTTLPGIAHEIIRDDEETLPTAAPEIQIPVRQPITLADNVTIIQAENVSDKPVGEPITPDDPEYMNVVGGDMYLAAEGKAFRNDKIISIDLFDEYYGLSYTISFGYITGECNRWLYLNPTYNGEHWPDMMDFYYVFSVVDGAGGGVVETFSPNYESYEQMVSMNDNFVTGRAQDHIQPATYYGPGSPGAVWYMPYPAGNSAWVDCLVYLSNGDLLATLRLTIQKDEDGAYNIVNLEDKNMLTTQSDNAYLPKDEQAYLYGIALEDLQNLNLMQVSGCNTIDYTVERFLMEYRDEHSGLYYDYFKPVEGNYIAKGSEYMYNPVIAVSCRQFMNADTIVLYYSIVKPATDTEHGIYEYIGRDHLFYQNESSLATQGYPGMVAD